jgi:hypothetical protein
MPLLRSKYPADLLSPNTLASGTHETSVGERLTDSNLSTLVSLVD